MHHEEIYFMKTLIQRHTNCNHLGNTEESEKRVIAATTDFNIKTNVFLSTSRNVNSKVELEIL